MLCFLHRQGVSTVVPLTAPPNQQMTTNTFHVDRHACFLSQYLATTKRFMLPQGWYKTFPFLFSGNLFLFIFLIGAQLLCNVILVSAIQQHGSAPCRHTCPPYGPPSHPPPLLKKTVIAIRGWSVSFRRIYSNPPSTPKHDLIGSRVFATSGRDFPGGPLVKNSPSDAGDTGLTPSWGIKDSRLPQPRPVSAKSN